MFVFIKKKYFGLLDALDNFSAGVARITYNFGPLIGWQPREKSAHPRQLQSLLPWLEAAGVLALISACAIISRQAQFDVMAAAMQDYFLSGLRNVSTTNDAGFFMSEARQWAKDIQEGKGFFDVNAAQLPGYLVAKISLACGLNLEQAGRYLVYGSVIATGFSAYLLLLVIGQSFLGVLVGCGTVFFFPIYSRTSLGMIDTDQLNLFFLLTTLVALAAAAQSRRWQSLIIYAALAAIIYQIFLLWYPRTGFLLAFLGAFLGMLLAFRTPLKRAIVGYSIFGFMAGGQQYSDAWKSLSEFLVLYVSAPAATLKPSASVDSTGGELQSTIFATIGEIQRLSPDLIRNDYGTLTAFVIAVSGLLIWSLQDWRRLAVVSPLFAFLALYIVSGQRFSFFAAPLMLIGLWVFIATVTALPLRRMIRHLEQLQKKPSPFGHTSEVREKSVAWLGQDWRLALVRRSLAGVSVFFLAWPAGVFPPLGVTPPPVIHAEELRLANGALQAVGREDTILASWWDYGYELNYQTGLRVVSDGSDPASIKNVYLARALISPNPYFAADEIRFAAYFETPVLAEFYPRRPTLDLAIGTNKDIYIFLPSTLQYRMIAVYNIAATTISSDALKTYSAESSAFFTLYHRQPLQWGPFVKVAAQRDGGVVYRLPAPLEVAK